MGELQELLRSPYQIALPRSGRHRNPIEVAGHHHVGKDLAGFGGELGVVGVPLREVGEHQLPGPRLGRPPTEEEVVAESGLAHEQVEAAFDVAQVVASLDQPARAGGETTLGELAAADQTAAVEETVLEDVASDELHRAVRRLPALERSVVEVRFGLAGEAPAGVTAAAAKLHMSRRRLRDVEARALALLAESPELAGGAQAA